ncbi:MAG: Asp/Glu racemase [Rhodospirillales bacterium]|nr:Asp/Glu racemase [Rhodospirillales bacterium]
MKQHGKRIGLVHGLGPGATSHYYHALVREHAARGLEMQLLITHAEVQRVFGFISADDLSGLAAYLAGFIEQLGRGGAEFAAIGAVTPHICMPILSRITPLPLIDIVQVTADELKARGVRRVAVFGTRFVMESNLFGGLGDIEIVAPRPAELDRIQALYLSIVQAGSGTQAVRRELVEIGQELQRREGAEMIVLAGSELALVFDENETALPVFDCARAHLDAIMRAVAE